MDPEELFHCGLVTTVAGVPLTTAPFGAGVADPGKQAGLACMYPGGGASPSLYWVARRPTGFSAAGNAGCCPLAPGKIKTNCDHFTKALTF